MAGPGSAFAGVIGLLGITLLLSIAVAIFAFIKLRSVTRSFRTAAYGLQASILFTTLWLIFWLSATAVLYVTHFWSDWQGLITKELDPLFASLLPEYMSYLHLKGISNLLSAIACASTICIQVYTTRTLSSRPSGATYLSILITTCTCAVLVAIGRLVCWEMIANGKHVEELVYNVMNWLVLGILALASVMSFTSFFFARGAIIQSYYSPLMAVNCLTLLRQLEEIPFPLVAVYIRFSDDFAATDEILAALARGMPTVICLIILVVIVYSEGRSRQKVGSS